MVGLRRNAWPIHHLGERVNVGKKSKRSRASRKASDRDPAFAYSQTDLAGRVGRTRQSIAKLAKRDDWPFGNPIEWPVRISNFQRWADRTLVRGKPGPAPGGISANGISADGDVSIASLRAAKLLEEVRKLRTENERLGGRLVDRQQVEREVSALIHNMRSALTSFAASCADKADAEGYVVDGGRQGLHAMIEGEMESLLVSFADGAEIAVDSLD